MKTQELSSRKRFRASITLPPPFHDFLLITGVSRGSTHSSENGAKKMMEQDQDEISDHWTSCSGSTGVPVDD